MHKEGIGESSAFGGYHPWVNLTYYLLAVGITMFSMSPWFLAVTFLMAWIYSLLLRGTEVIRTNLIITFWSLILMAVINVFFTHDGVTVLFYLNDNAITLEALLYGLAAAVMLVSVILWFSGFNVIMTSEKLIYIFGKGTPVLGLTLSMIFRYIPLLKSRFAQIRMGQNCMGATEQKGFFNKMRQFAKEASVLVSWSLESSIESADSMEARGYGLRGRTSFHLYRMTARDWGLLLVLLALGGIVIAGALMGKTKVQFYPAFALPPMDVMTGVTLGAYALLLALPIMIDIKGVLQWRSSDFRM